MHNQDNGITDNASLNQRDLPKIIDSMLEGLQILSFDWKYVYVNEALVSQSHYTRDQLIGSSIFDLYPGVQDTDVFSALKACMENRTSNHIETEFEFPDKKKSWFELSIQPIAQGILILSVDITNRKEAQEKFAAKQRKYRTLFEQASDGIFVSDQSGRYLEVNQHACDMLGYTKDELLAMTVYDLLTDGDPQPVRFDLLRDGQSLLTARQLKRKDGSFISAEISSKMLEDGKMLGIVRDITGRRQAEEQARVAEQKFRKLTETAFDAIILMNRLGNITFWNRGAELIFGYTQKDVLEKPLTVIMPERLRALHENGLARYLATGQHHVMGKVVEMEGQRKNGEIFPIEISITSWQSNGENIFSGIIRDITERTEARDKIQKLNENLEQKVLERTAQLEETIHRLKESEEKFEKAFYASTASISISRLPDSRFVDVNDTFVRLTEYSREEILGKTSAEIGMNRDVERRQHLLDELRANGAVHDIEIAIRTKSGKVLDMLSSSQIIILNGQEFVLTIAYDITEQKIIRQQLQTTNEELEAFTYSVSHDLRAPLRLITGYSEMLLEDFGETMDERALKNVKTIRRNVERMNVLIDALLEFSKSGKGGLQRSNVNTVKMIENCLHTVEPSYSNKTEVIVNALPDVYADPNLLNQAWFNLISNAFKYSAKVSHPRIEIGSVKREDEIEFFIRDNGAGFNMQYADKLFNVFQRLHSTAEFEGTGIGLSLVKRIVERHGGQVWAMSAPNEGATFFFTVPIVSPTS